MTTTPEYILEESTKLNVGETLRIRHKYTSIGDICSLNKSPACNITKTSTGCIWHCFRCKESGFIHNNYSPSQIKQLTYDKPMKTKQTIYTELPKDFQPINRFYHCDIPDQATEWLRKYNMSIDQVTKNDIGWSPLYQRVIIPLYEYGYFGVNMAKKLVGWCGRDPIGRSKNERTQKRIPKYLTKSNSDIKHPKFYLPKNNLFVESEFEDLVVYVEDILSAIKINWAVGCETIAALTTYIPLSNVTQHKNKVNILWLDYDQRVNMVKLTKKFNSWNINTTFISTPKDPKALKMFEIRELITERSRLFKTAKGL